MPQQPPAASAGGQHGSAARRWPAHASAYRYLPPGSQRSSAFEEIARVDTKGLGELAEHGDGGAIGARLEPWVGTGKLRSLSFMMVMFEVMRESRKHQATAPDSSEEV